MRINRNTLARDVTKAEGLKVSVSIAQVKEVQRLILEELACKYGEDATLALLRRVVAENVRG